MNELALKYGHKVLMLLSYDCHFNPIEIVQGITKLFYNKNIDKTNEKIKIF